MRHILIIFGAFLIYLCIDSTANAQKPDEGLMAWSEKAAVEVMTFDHTNYEERKAENKIYFSEKGYVSFYEALMAASIPVKIQHEKSALTAALKCRPYVTEVQNFPSQHVWQATFPLELTYKGEQGTTSEIQIVAMDIEQNPATKSLGIDQWIASPFMEGDRYPCLPELSLKPAPAND